MRIRVSPNRRSLTLGGRPFFYLADTAWHLLRRLNRAECDVYLRDRAAKGFTVIHTAILAGRTGLTAVNAYGYPPVRASDPLQPVEEYFDHIDWVMHRAQQLGLRLALAPAWNDEDATNSASAPAFAPLASLSAEQARTLGEGLGSRYRDDDVVWLLSGNTATERPIVTALAQGLRRGGRRAHLLACVPPPGTASAPLFPIAPWLDFNVVCGGAGPETRTDALLRCEYRRRPAKPLLDVTGADATPVPRVTPEVPAAVSDAEHRIVAYRAVFNGACGHAYATTAVSQFHDPGRGPMPGAGRRWQDALHLPAAQQLRHLRALVDAHPSVRTPAPELAKDEDCAALRSVRRDTALVYTATGRPFAVTVGQLAGAEFAVRWLDPRTGTWHEGAPVRRANAPVLTPPAEGCDWVLRLETSRTGLTRARRSPRR